MKKESDLDGFGLAAKWTPYDVRAQIEAEQDEP